jgi:transposase-like protein
MIQETTKHVCRVCKSTHIVKNGTNRCGNAQCHCKDCGAYRVLKPKQAYSETEQQTVLRACLERCSLRGIARIFVIARQTVAQWFKAHVQTLPNVKETLLPATPDEVLEWDEIWSCVQKKEQKRWVWTAMCRRTRQIVAFVIGDREPCDLSPLLEDDSRGIHTLPYLQRFLACLSTRVPGCNPSLCWKGN